MVLSKRGRRLIYVHGHALKPAEPALTELSFSAIRSGIQRDYPDDMEALDTVDLELVYYGDLIRDALPDAHYDEDLDVGDRRIALQALQAVPQRKKFGFRQYDTLPGKSALKEFVADVCAPLLGVLGLTLPLVSRVAPDFVCYLRNENDFATRSRERLRERLIPAMENGDRLMILAHGMGAVIAFDVLWQLSRDPRFKDYAEVKIDTLVTMGAPLCDNFIRRYLLGRNEKGLNRFPGNIISWQNLAAEDDYVCHDGTVADDFAVMMRERIVSQIRDYRIYNQAVRYGRSNPHSSVGYLIHPRLSKLIRDWAVSDVQQASSQA